MPDLSEFEVLGTPAKDRCKMGRILDQFEGADRDNLEAALIASHIGHVAITRWCEARKVRVSEKAVRTHRVGACCCA